MGFIGDEDKIRKITGYGVGELYEKTNVSQNQKIKCVRIECARDRANILDIGKLKYDDNGKTIYNGATFNFHLYPKDENVAIRIAKEIREKRIAVIKAFENMEQLGSIKIKTLKTKGEFNKVDKADDGMIYISGKSDGSGGYGAGGGAEFKNLYRYILAMKNNRKYELNFMRFFIDRENKVNCILKEIQFDRCMDDRELSGVNYDQEKCKVCYPTSRQSQTTRRDKIIEENSKESLKSFCYNPAVSFYYNSEDKEGIVDNAKMIAEEFIEFIDACDKRSKTNG